MSHAHVIKQFWLRAAWRRLRPVGEGETPVRFKIEWVTFQRATFNRTTIHRGHIIGPTIQRVVISSGGLLNGRLLNGRAINGRSAQRADY